LNTPLILNKSKIERRLLKLYLIDATKIKSVATVYSEVKYEDKKYGVSRTNFNSGKIIKVYAKELGGKHFISFNY
jgi:hypothetical protein